MAVVEKTTWEWIEKLEEEISGQDGFRHGNHGAKWQLEEVMDVYLALTSKQTDFLEGRPEDVASTIVQHLFRERII